MPPSDSLDLTPDQHLRLLELEAIIDVFSRDETAPEHLDIADNYLADCAALPPAARRLLLDRLCARFIEAEMPVSVFVPFLFTDPDDGIAAEAVHRVARYWPGGAYASDDFAAQMRSDLAYVASTGDCRRAAVLLHSLLTLGDRRLVVRLHGMWRLFGRKGRRTLCRRLSRCAQAPVLEWMTSWLGEAQSVREASDIAEALICAGQVRRHDSVYEIRRPEGRGEAFRVVRHWSFSAFGGRLATRWRRLRDKALSERLYSAWSQPNSPPDTTGERNA